MRAPSYDEIREFLRIDRWTRTRKTGHESFEKVLPNGELLETRASWSGSKTMSPGRFKAILADQLKLDQEQFWEALRTGEPAVLAELAEQAARELLDEARSHPRDD